MKSKKSIGCGAVSSKENDANVTFGRTFDVFERRENTILVRLHGEKNYTEFDLNEVIVYWKS